MTEYPQHWSATTADSRATALLKRAHESHYRWPATFRGFRAGVTIACDGECTSGVLRVVRGGGSSLRSTDETSIPPDHAAEVIAAASRLTAKSFDDLDGRYGGRFRARLDRDSATAVVLVGDPRRTVRWIEQDRLVETEFDFEGHHHHFGVSATTTAPDRRWLPEVTWERRTRDGAVLSRDLVEEWATLGDVIVPARRSVVSSGGPWRRLEITLHDHRNDHVDR